MRQSSGTGSIKSARGRSRRRRARRGWLRTKTTTAEAPADRVALGHRRRASTTPRRRGATAAPPLAPVRDFVARCRLDLDVGPDRMRAAVSQCLHQPGHRLTGKPASASAGIEPRQFVGRRAVTAPVAPVVRSSVSSCISTGTSSSGAIASNSTARNPCSNPTRNAARVFSGARCRRRDGRAHEATARHESDSCRPPLATHVDDLLDVRDRHASVVANVDREQVQMLVAASSSGVCAADRLREFETGPDPPRPARESRSSRTCPTRRNPT